jgi:hypothetical protein
MSISLPSVRRAAVGALGAGVLSGAMLFGALPMAQAASVPAPAPTGAPGALHVAPAFWGHNHHHHDHHHRHDLHHSLQFF